MISIKRTFIIRTRRHIARGFTAASLPNLQVLRRGWHKKMFIKVSFSNDLLILKCSRIFF